MTEDKLLTLRQAAELFQIEEKVVGQLLRDGYLRGYKIGRGWRISLDDLTSFTRNHPNVSPGKLRSNDRANRHSGAPLHLEAPVLPTGPRVVEVTKPNSEARETHRGYTAHEYKTSWVPPWRLGE